MRRTRLRRVSFVRAALAAGGILALCLAYARREYADADGYGAVALAAGVLLAFLAAGSTSPAAERVVRWRLDYYDVTFAGCALGEVSFAIPGDGVPSFRQDWFLSPDGHEFSRDLVNVLSSWQPIGLGTATPQAGFHPLVILWGFIAWIAGSHWSVIGFLAGVYFAMGYAARRIASGLPEITAAGGILAGLAYQLSPVVFNRTVAGHTFHLFGSAVVAACAAVALSLGPRRSAFRACILLALLIASTGEQPQASVLASVVTLCVAVSRGRPLIGVCAVGLASLLTLPTFAAAVISHGDDFVVKRAVLDWQLGQSAPPSLLLSQSGYLARYFDNDAAWYSVGAAYVITALALAGFTFIRDRSAGAIALLGACAALVIAGLRGPLAFPIAWIYQNIAAASLFREIYDIAPLFSLSLCVGVGYFTSIVVPRKIRMAPLILAATAVCVAALPFIDGTLRRLVPTYGDARVVRALAAVPGEGSFLWLPGRYPLSTRLDSGEGFDPYTRRAGAHRGLFGYQPIPALALAYALDASGSASAPAWLERLGVDAIAEDNGAREVLRTANDRRIEGGRSFGSVNLHPLARARDRIAGSGVVVESGLAGRPLEPGFVSLSLDNPANANVAAAFVGSPLNWQLFAASVGTANPAKGLVLGANFWTEFKPYARIPAASAVVGSGLSVEAGPGVLVGAWSAAPSIGGRTVNLASDIVLAHEEHVHFPADFALVGVRSGPPRLRAVAAPAERSDIQCVERRPTNISCALTGGTTSAVIFRERFDKGWELDAGGPPPQHFSADGWENAWLVKLRSGDRFTIEYGPQNLIDRLEAFSALGWALLIAALFAGPRLGAKLT